MREVYPDECSEDREALLGRIKLVIFSIGKNGHLIESKIRLHLKYEFLENQSNRAVFVTIFA